MQHKKTMYSTEEAAAVLGVSGSRVRQFVLAGRLEATRVGARWVIKHGDLMTFKRKKRKTGKPRRS